MDWADELAAVAMRDNGTVYDDPWEKMQKNIATALRKAKADGYREGAASYEEYGTTKVWEEIEAYALKIEKGEE